MWHDCRRQKINPVAVAAAVEHSIAAAAAVATAGAAAKGAVQTLEAAVTMLTLPDIGQCCQTALQVASDGEDVGQEVLEELHVALAKLVAAVELAADELAADVAMGKVLSPSVAVVLDPVAHFWVSLKVGLPADFAVHVLQVEVELANLLASPERRSSREILLCS